MEFSWEVQTLRGLAAVELVNAAVAQAQSDGVLVSVAACDAAGHLLAFRRMDGAMAGTVRMAEEKARTAALFGLATHVWYRLGQEDPELDRGVHGALTTLGGGYPVRVPGGALLGGLGVSGAHHEHDRAIAKSALEKVGINVSGTSHP